MNLPSGRWAYLTLIAGLVHFFILAWLGLAHHWGYLSSIQDLGNFDQAVWGTVNGVPFLNTNNPFNVPLNWLGIHFNPILLVFIPFYYVYPAAEWLTLFQAAALSITAWPLYVLALRVHQSERIAFFWAVAYLGNPFVLNAASWDFHPVSLATPFMALGMLAVERSSIRIFFLACFSLLLIQEQYGIAVAGFGILWWLRNKSLAPALAVLCAGVIHAVLVFGIIMPALSPTGGHVMISSGLGQLSRYGWIGASVGGVIQNIVLHPLSVLKTTLIDLGGAKYLTLLMLSLLATPLAGIEFLLPGLADLLANLLSDNSMPRNVFAYHSIGLVPVLVAAGIYGAPRIASLWRRYSPGSIVGSADGIAGFVLLASLLAGYITAPLPLPYSSNFWQARAWPLAPERAVSEIRNLMPPTASVSAQANVAAHFSHRYRIYPFPMNAGKVDFIVLRLASPTGRMASRHPGEIGPLAHHLAMPPEQYLSTVEGLLGTNAYGVVYWNPPWLVLSRGEETPEATARGVNLHLTRLKSDWKSAEAVQGTKERLLLNMK